MSQVVRVVRVFVVKVDILGGSVLASAASLGVVAIMLVTGPAHAQSSPPPADDEAASTQEDQSAADAEPQGAASDSEIIVTGFRRSLSEAIELKRESTGLRDSIVAEDIGKFPEANVADSMQRIPGVILSRDGSAGSNEGQRVEIRGLGAEFVQTTLNGAPVRTTSSGSIGNRTISERCNSAVDPSSATGPHFRPFGYWFAVSSPCMVIQLTKASNQPVLVVSFGYIPKPCPPCS
jgi:iron complex outermembrane receptor protein